MSLLQFYRQGIRDRDKIFLDVHLGIKMLTKSAFHVPPFPCASILATLLGDWLYVIWPPSVIVLVINHLSFKS